MHPKAIMHSREKLKIARKAIDEMAKTGSTNDLAEYWPVFLHAVSSIYSKLEQGSKIDGKSAAWYGRMKKVRKDDSLLSYLHHARNAEKYGLDDILKSVGIMSYVEYRGNTERITFRAAGSVIDGKDDIITSTNGEEMRKTRVWTDPWPNVVRVKDDRFQDEFDPPTSHLGQPIEHLDPSHLSQRAYPYLEQLVNEAETYVTQP